MTDPELIGPVQGSTSVESGIQRDRVRPLPYDLLKEASKRLEIMSLVGAGLWVFGTVGDRIALLAMPHGNRIWHPGQTTDIIAATGVFASLALFIYVRKGDRD